MEAVPTSNGAPATPVSAEPPKPEVTKPAPEVTKPAPEVTKPVPENTKPEADKPATDLPKPAAEPVKAPEEAANANGNKQLIISKCPFICYVTCLANCFSTFKKIWYWGGFNILITECIFSPFFNHSRANNLR